MCTVTQAAPASFAVRSFRPLQSDQSLLFPLWKAYSTITTTLRSLNPGLSFSRLTTVLIHKHRQNKIRSLYGLKVWGASVEGKLLEQTHERLWEHQADSGEQELLLSQRVCKSGDRVTQRQRFLISSIPFIPFV